MMYVVSYDISEDKMRKKLADLLCGYGVRIQYSVFECDLTGKRFEKMYAEIAKLVLDIKDGSVRIYSVCEKCRERIVTIGEPISRLERLSQDVIVI